MTRSVGRPTSLTPEVQETIYGMDLCAVGGKWHEAYNHGPWGPEMDMTLCGIDFLTTGAMYAQLTQAQEFVRLNPQITVNAYGRGMMAHWLRFRKEGVFS